jgi:general stress protein YciG
LSLVSVYRKRLNRLQQRKRADWLPEQAKRNTADPKNKAAKFPFNAKLGGVTESDPESINDAGKSGGKASQIKTRTLRRRSVRRRRHGAVGRLRRERLYLR